jgi:hypothetical protein
MSFQASLSRLLFACSLRIWFDLLSSRQQSDKNARNKEGFDEIL